MWYREQGQDGERRGEAERVERAQQLDHRARPLVRARRLDVRRQRREEAAEVDRRVDELALDVRLEHLLVLLVQHGVLELVLVGRRVEDLVVLRREVVEHRLEGVLLDDAVDEADGALDLERVV